MVTGALRKNKKKRKNGSYSLENRVKILSGDEITLNSINDRIKTGCLVVLENFKNGKSAIVNKLDFNDRTMRVAYYDFSISYIHMEDYKFEINNQQKYNLERESLVNPLWGNLYNVLNKKLSIAKLNQNDI
jgi:hypothetical protein